MAENYKIGDVKIDESQAFVRIAKLTAGTASCDGLAHSFGPPFTQGSDAEGTHPLNEGYLVLTLAKLRELDSDAAKQDEYIRKKLLGPDSGRVNALFINVNLGPGDKLIAKDIEYLNDLLLWGQNHIYVPPTISFPDGIPLESRIGLYSKFVTDLLAVKRKTTPGRLRPGITVPAYFGRGALEMLFDLYSEEPEEPAFVAIDYGNSRISSPSNGLKVAYLHRHFKSVRKTEAYFLYALRAKGRKRGQIPAPAEDLATLLAGVNAIGRPHNLAPGGGQIDFSWEALVGLSQEKHEYNRINGTPSTRRAFIDYVKSRTTVPAPNFSSIAQQADAKYMNIIQNFNRRALNLEGAAVSKEVADSDARGLKRRLHGKESVAIAKRALGSS